MMFGSHHDAPVTLPDSMRVLSATVTRKSRTGRVLGPEHRVPVATASARGRFGQGKVGGANYKGVAFFPERPLSVLAAKLLNSSATGGLAAPL